VSTPPQCRASVSDYEFKLLVAPRFPRVIADGDARWRSLIPKAIDGEFPRIYATWYSAAVSHFSEQLLEYKLIVAPRSACDRGRGCPMA